MNEAIRLDPKLKLPYDDRGTSGLSVIAGKVIADYNEYLAAYPGDASAWTNRARAYEASKDYDRAIADIDRSVQLNPQVAASYSVRAIAYEAKGEPAKAIADYTSAIALDPKLTAAYNSRGRLYQVATATGPCRIGVIALDPKTRCLSRQQLQ